MVHAGQPPLTTVKYGVNCFFNEDRLRLMRAPGTTPSGDVARVDLEELVAKYGELPDGVQRTFVLLQSLEIKALRRFATDGEVDRLVQASCAEGAADSCSRCALAGSAGTLRVFEHAELPELAELETRLSQTSGFPPENLGQARLVRHAGSTAAANRGCGQRAATICLSEVQEVLFPAIGMLVVLRRGDLLMWPNAWYAEPIEDVPEERQRVVEDLRTRRVYVGAEENQTLSLNLSLHQDAIRQEQRQETLRHKIQQPLDQQEAPSPSSGPAVAAATAASRRGLESEAAPAAAA